LFRCRSNQHDRLRNGNPRFCVAGSALRQTAALDLEESLLQSELLNSIAIMQIVAFCEEMFEINIPEEELVPENFENIRIIAELVTRIKGSAEEE
jgi:acyl carrier protein